MRLQRLMAIAPCAMLFLVACAPAVHTAGTGVPSAATTSPTAGRGDVAVHVTFPKRIGSTALGSTGAQVRAAFGDGLVTGGDTGAQSHYYLDAGHRVTLCVRIGTDDLVREVVLRRGMSPPAGAKSDDKSLFSPALSASAPTWDGLSLSSSYAEVVRHFGQPDREQDEGMRRLLFYDLRTNGAPLTAQLIILRGELHSIDIYGPG
jgi:hypothetical protein